ncbi:MAG: aspartate carbamoyltransferase catalytic subunit [Verrucomicrobiales bacterium]|nr:aspartate carbamoyltransferase catalytic subunit [Verrucomicrobiales bacterium]HQW28430.1 aspartate carbamoyltransferase catalytic subunit [Verrucomicrobiales bacterium]
MSELKPRKDLLDIESLELAEIEYVLENAVPFKQLFQRSVKKVPTLRGKTVLNLFYEPSTRTSTSFEVAANRMSADVTNFTVSSSSVVKGESLLDTIETLQAMRSDYIVIRHQAAGVPGIVAKNTGASVINAGDGHHAHPTQALLDAMTLREVYPDYQGRKVVIVGDILHSRVARSTSTLLHKLGIEVAVLGPGSLVPEGRHDFMTRLRSWDEVFDWKPDAVYLLRVQMERQEGQFFPSIAEYHKMYGMNSERLVRMRELGAYLMHPGPVNRGVEITDEAMRYERSLISTQVENGIAVRMAVLHWLKPETDKD